MAIRRNAAVDAQLAKLKCPGGRGHSLPVNGEYRMQLQCALCRTTAYKKPLPVSPPAVGNIEPPVGHLKRFR